jgi:hypothetical protein
MYQAFRRGLSRPLAGMEMRGPGANHRGELLSSIGILLHFLNPERFTLFARDSVTAVPGSRANA